MVRYHPEYTYYAITYSAGATKYNATPVEISFTATSSKIFDGEELEMQVTHRGQPLNTNFQFIVGSQKSIPNSKDRHMSSPKGQGFDYNGELEQKVWGHPANRLRYTRSKKGSRSE